ncbi:Hypothetical predicted protein, partial [Scomber scombrus]
MRAECRCDEVNKQVQQVSSGVSSAGPTGTNAPQEPACQSDRSGFHSSGTEDSGQTVTQGAEDSGQTVTRRAEDSGQRVTQGAEDSGQRVTQGADDSGQTVTQGAEAALDAAAT